MLVSVITPTYNRAHILKRAIDSAMGQTLTDFEIIVCDDASTDSTTEVVKSIDDKRIVYLRRETNSGYCTLPRNDALKVAQGKYVAYLDDDDVWTPGHLKDTVSLLEEKEEIGMVYSASRGISGQGEGVISKDFNLSDLKRHNYITVSSVVHRRECIDRAGYFDERLPYFEDWDLWLRIALEYKVKHIPEVSSVYHIHPGSISLAPDKKEVIETTRQEIIRKYEDAVPSYPKILIIQPYAIGDVLRATPVIRGLKEKYPGCYLAFLVGEVAAEVVSANPDLDEVYIINLKGYKEEYNTRGLGDAFKNLYDFTRLLQKEKFNLVVNLSLTEYCGLITYLTKSAAFLGLMVDNSGKICLTSGWGDKHTRIFESRESRLANKMHLTDIFCKIAEVEEGRYGLALHLEAEDVSFASETFHQHGIGEEQMVIGLNPGANWESKRWEPEKFAKLGDELIRRHGAKILLFGGPGDLELSSSVESLMEEKPINLAGATSLRQLGALMSRCRAVVANDTGPMHLSAAVKTPTVAIFGPTYSVEGGPYGEGHEIVEADVDCAPCFQPDCPIDDYMVCMRSIGVEKVLGAVERIISR